MGSFPLVAAKLAAPVPSGTLLDRERLYRRLDEGLEARLTLVVGPAGAGKSALVAGWTTSRAAELDRAWVNADPGDTSTRLVRHIGAAVGGSRSATALDASRSGLHTDLVRRAGRRLVIVIDDVHLIRSRHAIEALGAVASESPPHVHVVLVSRSDPHVGAAGRTGRADAEIRGHDLRLTDEEVAQIVGGHRGVDLDEQALGEITRKVDGWAAGLQLALGALARSDDPAQIVRTFGASTPAVADYLLDEVLGQLDGEERALLLDASVLEDLTGPDRLRVTGRDDIDDALSSLADRNLLIERYTDDSFRCHPLLRQLLQLRLRQDDEARFVRLHRLAAGGAEARGDLAGAVDHLLAAGAPQPVLALCRRHARALLAHGAGSLLVDWIGRLADHDLDEVDDQLALAGLLLDAGQPLGCALRLERCRRALGPEPPRAVARRLVQLQAECHHRLGEPESALVCARRAGVLADGTGPSPAVAAPEAFGLLWVGDLEGARVALARARPDDPVTLGLAASIEVAAGDLPAARALVRRALVDGEAAAVGVDLHARAAHAQLVVEGLDEADAEGAVEALVAEANRRRARGALVIGLCLRARVRWTRICVAAGIGALGYRSHVGLDRPLGPVLRSRLDRTEARLLVEAGDLAEAHRLLDGCPDDRATAILRGRAWAAAGDVDRALALLAEVDGAAVGPEIGAVALARARVLADVGDDRAAVAVAALVVAPATRHLRRTYLEEGDRFEAVLRATGPAGEALARELDGARRLTAATALSTRELTVLEYLPTRLTNQEIGTQVFVSANTVKTHLKNLYRRLGVSSRDEAVRRARDLGLLPPGREDALARLTTAALGPPEGDRSPAPAAAGPARRDG